MLTANSAADALSVIQEKRVDLAAVDLHMPEVDGLQLIMLLRRRCPQLVRVALTGDCSDNAKAKAFQSGAELYLAKPDQPEEWTNAFRAFDELIRFKPEEGFRGVLPQVSLQDILQLSCLTRRSMVLRVRSRDADGSIYLKNGDIVHASSDEHLGTEAFNRLMGLTAGSFEIEPFVEPREETIQEQWEFLLMEAAQKSDEAAEALQRRSSNASDLLALLSATAGVGKANEGKVPQRTGRPPSTEQSQPLVEELFICGTGSAAPILYSWQTANVQERIEFLQNLLSEGRQLGQLLPLGEFERLVIKGTQQRVVAAVKEERLLLVRTSRVVAR